MGVQALLPARRTCRLRSPHDHPSSDALMSRLSPNGRTAAAMRAETTPRHIRRARSEKGCRQRYLGTFRLACIWNFWRRARANGIDSPHRSALVRPGQGRAEQSDSAMPGRIVQDSASQWRTARPRQSYPALVRAETTSKLFRSSERKRARAEGILTALIRIC